MEDEGFKELLGAAQAGHEEAWAAIYSELAPALLGYLRAQGAAEPEDLLGELFLQMVRDIPGFAGGKVQFRAWAFTIAHHRLIDDGRYRARRPVEPFSPETLRESSGRYAGSAETRLADPRVFDALRRLPEEQRSIVLLRVLGDLSVADVARVLGKTPGAVKAAQGRAMATLKRRLTRSTVTVGAR